MPEVRQLIVNNPWIDWDSMKAIDGFWVGGPLCIVNFEQFATFASYSYRLEVTCDADNDYCASADIDGLNGVNIDDLRLLAAEWLNVCPANWPLE